MWKIQLKQSANSEPSNPTWDLRSQITTACWDSWRFQFCWYFWRGWCLNVLHLCLIVFRSNGWVCLSLIALLILTQWLFLHDFKLDFPLNMPFLHSIYIVINYSQNFLSLLMLPITGQNILYISPNPAGNNSWTSLWKM